MEMTILALIWCRNNKNRFLLGKIWRVININNGKYYRTILLYSHIQNAIINIEKYLL